MVEEEPAKHDENSRHFHQDESRAHNHSEVLLPEGHIEVDKGHNVVQESLPVDREVETKVAPNKDGLHKQVARCEEAGPHVAVARHQSALLVIKESLVVWAGGKKAVEGKKGGKSGVDQCIHLHPVIMKVALVQLEILRVDKLDHEVEDDVLGAKIGISNDDQLEVLN